MLKFKQTGLGFIALLLQIGVWWYIHRAFSHQASTLEWVWLGVLSALTISVTTFFFLTNKIRWYSEAIIVTSFLAYILLSTKNIYVITGGLLFLAFSFWYEMRLHSEAEGRLDFSVTRVVGGSVSVMIYGLLLLLGFNIYYNTAQSFHKNPDQLYNRLGQQAAKSVPYFSRLLPEGTNLNEPFGEYLSQQAQNNPDYHQASPFQQEVITGQVRDSFAQTFKVTPDDNQTLSDIIAQVAVNKVRQATGPYERYLPIIFTVIIVGLLYTFAFIIRWIIILVSWVVFEVLVLTGFFKLEKVLVEVRKLTI